MLVVSVRRCPAAWLVCKPAAPMPAGGRAALQALHHLELRMACELAREFLPAVRLFPQLRELTLS